MQDLEVSPTIRRKATISSDDLLKENNMKEVKRRNYGLPYQGSKSSIIKFISDNVPSCENFYDLFGGGFSVTDYLLSNRNDINNFHFNEIRPGVCDFIKEAINGEYSYEKFTPEWISKEGFFKFKDSNPYIKLGWSFGNSGKSYLFSKNIEPYKKSIHLCVVFGVFDEISEAATGLNKWPDNLDTIKKRRLYIKQKIESYRKNNLLPEILIAFLSEKQKELWDIQQLERLKRLQGLEPLERLERIQQLEQLQQLERIQQLQRLQQLYFYSLDYRNVPIKENSVIYCDIPYKGARSYKDGGEEFNHNEFYDWAANCDHPVFISEYKLDDTRFHLVASISKKCRIGASKRTESIYCNEVAFEVSQRPLSSMA